jgi:RNA recognition motif-containing protein
MNSAIGSLFVGDLSVCCRESHLLELFEVYGLVLKTEVKVGIKPFKFLGYGFVTMSTFEEAEIAMRSLDGVLVLGRRMR